MTTHDEEPTSVRELSDSDSLGKTGFWLSFSGAPSVPAMIFIAQTEGTWGFFLFLFVVLPFVVAGFALSAAGFVLGSLSMRREKHQNYGRVALLLSFVSMIWVAFLWFSLKG